MVPNGITSYLTGGLIIGVAVSFVYILTGTHATQSSIFTSTISYFSKLPFFQREPYLNSREWRLYFAAGVILGALLYTLTVSPDGFWVTGIPVWKLGLGGFFVGFGTRLSRGCTSGHGISGLASLSVTSLYAVITFIGVGVITVYVMRIVGL